MMKLDRKDLGAGAAFVAVGLLYGGIALFGGLMNPRLPMGQALSMGPGFFPVVLSGLLIILGGILIGRSFFASKETNFFDVISWRAIVMLSIAIILFGAFVRELGILLAIFLVTFLSALASRHVTVRYAFVVAIGVAIFCVAVFGPYGVRLPIPVIGTWFVN
jgi:hypothetical protein